jgi:signal transduction histidine kinase
MVDDLLVLARFDAGQIVLAQDRVDVASILRTSVQGLAPQADTAGVTLALDAPQGLIVWGDADRLAQVFTNLVANALAHTPAGGKVSLAAGPDHRGGGTEVVVTDTGEGIPADELARIFERFYQVDKARQRARGAGLGLAISREIVEAHGGTILVESVVGLGSKFTVLLPLPDPD